MNKTLLFLLFTTCFSIKSISQDGEIRKAEESFLDLLGQRLFSKLEAVTLAEAPYKKLYYYSYKIIDKDSVSWFSHNDKNKLIDSIALVSFTEAVDFMRKKELLPLLRNDVRTYLPIFIFYKIPYNDLFNDSISIQPMLNLFSWGKNDKLEAEPVYRITKPFTFILPKSKPYYQK